MKNKSAIQSLIDSCPSQLGTKSQAQAELNALLAVVEAAKGFKEHYARYPEIYWIQPAKDTIKALEQLQSITKG